MANPFYIEPANPLQALMMGVQGFDTAEKRGREAQLREARAAAGDAITNGGNLTSALGRLLGVGDTQGATVLAAIGKGDTTDELKEYKFDMAQRSAKGLAPIGFGDWKTQLKIAGSTKINNAVNMGEGEYAKTLGKGEAERFLGLQKGAQGAQDQLNTLQIMDNAMKDPNFYSGLGAERFALTIKQATSAFGGDPNGAASMETFRSQANKAVIDSMGGSLGSGFSNADRDFVVSQVPNLANTPEGNKTLIDVSRKVAQRKIEIAKMAREYAKAHGGKIDAGFDDAIQAYAEKNSLFAAPNSQPRSQGTPQGLPPGARQASDGKFYIPDPSRPGKYLMVQP